MYSARFPFYQFEETKKINPYWSSWICFTEMIKGKDNISKRTIRRAFDKAVDQDDYFKKERSVLLDFCYSLASRK